MPALCRLSGLCMDKRVHHHGQSAGWSAHHMGVPRRRTRPLDPSEFGRERLGWHDKPAIEDGPLISKEGWATKTDAKSQPGRRVAFAPINKLQQIAAATVPPWVSSDGDPRRRCAGGPRGQLVAMPGISWIPGRMKELKDTWNPCGWALDDRSAAGSLLPVLKKPGSIGGDGIEPGGDR